MFKQIKKSRKIVSSFLLLLSLLLTAPLPTFAQEDAGEVGYDIQAVIPENQIDKEKSFFDLRMEPAQEQTIHVKINNTSNAESTYKININQAYTNSQGFIDYNEKKESEKNDYPYAIDSIAKVADTVTVPKKSSKEVPITLTMPKDQFDGQILAAIQVVKETEKKQKGIVNSYGYILGLKLTETDTEVPRKLTLKKVEPAISFGKTSVVAILDNPTMDAYGHLKYEATVKNRKTNKEVRHVTYDNDMQLAPNSTYRFAIDWEKEPLTAGEYSLHLRVTDAKDNEWIFDENFTISAKQAKEINEATIDAGKKATIPMWIYLVFGILLGVILLGIFWIILLKRRKKEEESETETK